MTRRKVKTKRHKDANGTKKRKKKVHVPNELEDGPLLEEVVYEDEVKKPKVENGQATKTKKTHPKTQTQGSILLVGQSPNEDIKTHTKRAQAEVTKRKLQANGENVTRKTKHKKKVQTQNPQIPVQVAEEEDIKARTKRIQDEMAKKRLQDERRLQAEKKKREEEQEQQRIAEQMRIEEEKRRQVEEALRVEEEANETRRLEECRLMGLEEEARKLEEEVELYSYQFQRAKGRLQRLQLDVNVVTNTLYVEPRVIKEYMVVSSEESVDVEIFMEGCDPCVDMVSGKRKDDKLLSLQGRASLDMQKRTNDIVVITVVHGGVSLGKAYFNVARLKRTASGKISCWVVLYPSFESSVAHELEQTRGLERLGEICFNPAQQSYFLSLLPKRAKSETFKEEYTATVQLVGSRSSTPGSFLFSPKTPGSTPSKDKKRGSRFSFVRSPKNATPSTPNSRKSVIRTPKSLTRMFSKNEVVHNFEIKIIFRGIVVHECSTTLLETKVEFTFKAPKSAAWDLVFQIDNQQFTTVGNLSQFHRIITTQTSSKQLQLTCERKIGEDKKHDDDEPLTLSAPPSRPQSRGNARAKNKAIFAIQRMVRMHQARNTLRHRLAVQYGSMNENGFYRYADGEDCYFVHPESQIIVWDPPKKKKSKRRKLFIKSVVTEKKKRLENHLFSSLKAVARSTTKALSASQKIKFAQLSLKFESSALENILEIILEGVAETKKSASFLTTCTLMTIQYKLWVTHGPYYQNNTYLQDSLKSAQEAMASPTGWEEWDTPTIDCCMRVLIASEQYAAACNALGEIIQIFYELDEEAKGCKYVELHACMLQKMRKTKKAAKTMLALLDIRFLEQHKREEPEILFQMTRLYKKRDGFEDMRESAYQAFIKQERDISGGAESWFDDPETWTTMANRYMEREAYCLAVDSYAGAINRGKTLDINICVNLATSAAHAGQAFAAEDALLNAHLCNLDQSSYSREIHHDFETRTYVGKTRRIWILQATGFIKLRRKVLGRLRYGVVVYGIKALKVGVAIYKQEQQTAAIVIQKAIRRKKARQLVAIAKQQRIRAIALQEKVKERGRREILTDIWKAWSCHAKKWARIKTMMANSLADKLLENFSNWRFEARRSRVEKNCAQRKVSRCWKRYWKILENASICILRAWRRFKFEKRLELHIISRALERARIAYFTRTILEKQAAKKIQRNYRVFRAKLMKKRQPVLFIMRVRKWRKRFKLKRELAYRLQPIVRGFLARKWTKKLFRKHFRSAAYDYVSGKSLFPVTKTKVKKHVLKSLKKKPRKPRMEGLEDGEDLRSITSYLVGAPKLQANYIIKPVVKKRRKLPPLTVNGNVSIKRKLKVVIV